MLLAESQNMTEHSECLPVRKKAHKNTSVMKGVINYYFFLRNYHGIQNKFIYLYRSLIIALLLNR